MKPDIIGKIAQLLETLPINDEPRAAYLLLEIRKVFEHEPHLQQALPTLQFYCNWALHTKLDRGPTQQFLRAVNPILSMHGIYTEDESRVLNKLLTLESFREELTTFLGVNSIPTSLCTDDGNWSQFLAVYSRIAQDAELMLADDMPPSGPLNLAVQSVTIRPVNPLSLVPAWPYPMEWFVQYADGRRARLALSGHGLLGARIILG
jgi:hypothetical protein